MKIVVLVWDQAGEVLLLAATFSINWSTLLLNALSGIISRLNDACGFES